MKVRWSGSAKLLGGNQEGEAERGAGSAPVAEPVRRYRAFISYSHEDERVARRLHHWLETYRIPRKSVGRRTSQGIVPARLTPIFRDRNEFAAADDLSDEVTSALSASDALIILCSPAAKASRWVDSEIRLFRRLHPERKLLLGLLAGEPDISFPSAVLEAGPDGHAREPIAADFRRNGDGHRLARLKIVAGLVGLPLDEIIQRDSQRQLRRVTAITLAALVAALMLGFMLAFALNARDQAERQRQQAEGLIEFMLTDLRSRLQGVGRLDILGAVNDKALAYYASEKDLVALPDASLERRARVLHAMGADAQRSGHGKVALQEFEEARRATAALLKKDPKNPDRIFAHAQSEFWLGYAAFARRNDDIALPRFQTYLHLANQLNMVEPNTPRSMRELAYAHGNICSLYLDKANDPNASLKACRAALVTMQAVAKAIPTDPSVWSDLANREAWMSQALEQVGDVNAALDARQRQIAYVDKLVASDRNNASYRQDWVLAQFSTAKLLRKIGRTSQAIAAASRSAESLDRLIALDGKNEDWRLWRAEITATFPTLARKD